MRNTHLGALISAEPGRGRTRHSTPVEFVGGPQCGHTETIAHRGLAPPRTLHGRYHRLGRRTCDSGACRYDYGRPAPAAYDPREETR